MSQPKLTLYRGFPRPAQYVPSPFVTKLEFRLRLAGVPYATATGSPRSAPRGKIPYAILPDGEVVSDSALIIRRLEEKGTLPPLGEHLSAAERAQALCVRALLEDRLYFYQMRERWIDNYTTQRDAALSALPWPMRWLIGWMAYRSIVTTLHGQGTGRFTDEEVAGFKAEGWGAVNDLLEASFSTMKQRGDEGKCFWVLGGTEPTEADLVVFGFVVGVLASESAPASARLVRGLPVLVEYARRVHGEYFPDYDGFV